MELRVKDKTGKKYWRLSVIEPIGIGKDRSMWFKCRCDCGKEVTVSGSRLRTSKYGTKSCGCLRDDKYKSLARSTAISKGLKKQNDYVFMPDCVVGITARGEKFYTTDNRKTNLRVCTHQQNGFNLKAKGYYYDKKIKRWIVRIGLNYKTIHIGCFKTEAEAKNAREKAAIQYYGEYRYREVI